jgi:undecaprenyl diphosphate synthase
MAATLAIEDASPAALVRSSNLRHLAIIMDGNRRWARQRHLPPLGGHEQGTETLRRTALYANDLGLSYLTVYAFSTENWLRPLVEVSGLMELFASSLVRLLPEFHRNGIRLCFFGDLSQLSASLRSQFLEAMDETRSNRRMVLQMAMSYGSRREIVQACVALIREYQASGRSPEALKEEDFAKRLYMPGCPDPDAILRTGGEQRLSNFLLWQAAYAEVMRNDVLWPDFSASDLDQAIAEFARRKRRFGR